ncbi:hypothetical protein E4634_00095 [Mangrovimicrobium sediminis]|uniref:Uncharacterized protein n=1 Tax=Mangrovimicrobium sediminis TaxID=2562682 RepID=A0A4Z0M8G1_9GAMM|nr:hypothetical protein [Haliea sp. SAOS-164]TGD75993.1 hypothetical protein E4634_00095 [Haliea sp. SAOS-164]
MNRRLMQRDFAMASHFPSLAREMRINPDSHMFAEDIRLFAMPIRHPAPSSPNYNVNLVGAQSEVSRTKDLLSQFSGYGRHSNEELLIDAIGEIVLSLSHEGRALYEIHQQENGQTTLNQFTSQKLIKLPFYYVQLIPAIDQELWKRKFSKLRSSRVWKIEMPSRLGGYKGYRKILSELGRFDSTGPKYWREELENGTISELFNFSEYSLNRDIYLNRITRAWGWNRRAVSSDRSTEYFTIYKSARFNLSEAILREHIIQELNHLLSKLRIECKIQVTGLPTESGIEEALEQLEKGNIGFEEIVTKITI